MPKSIGYGPGPSGSKQAAQHRADQVGTPTDKPVSDKARASTLPSNPQYGNPGYVANDAPGSTEAVIGVSRK